MRSHLLSGHFYAKKYSIGTILFVKSIVIGKCSEAGVETDDGEGESGQKECRYCLRAYRNWFDEITNSFDCPWNNGYVEGMHNRLRQ
ncbi:transposase [Aedoeadaptatus coxii]|uniref:transposase n=1 Tax=Aedoeadaptatus coxii TaxID=755172 RepID=UPI00390811D5